MTDSRTNPFSNGAFVLGQDKIEARNLENVDVLPYIDGRRAWEQYTNPFVYEFDKLVREFIIKMSESSSWRTQIKKRKYTYSMIIERLYNRPYDSKIDSGNGKQASRILAYYSSKIQKQGFIDGKHYSKHVYTLSPTRVKRQPYSLRLRLEWLQEQGKLPTYLNMKLPKDDLTPGHARNKRTNANMERRTAEAKARYNERYKDRKH